MSNFVSGISLVCMGKEKFYIRRYRKRDGVYVSLDDREMSLEDDFGFVRYKSMSGLNAVGKIKSVYTETYAEREDARVYMSDKVVREQTSCTLSVYMFGSDPSAPASLTVQERICNAEKSWAEFYSRLEGCLVLWRDDYRQRKALFYVVEAPDVKSDVIKNIPYLQCDVKLTNVFGRTFALEDKTIESWLGKEVGNGGQQ